MSKERTQKELMEYLRNFGESRKRLGGMPFGYEPFIQAADLIEKQQAQIDAFAAVIEGTKEWLAARKIHHACNFNPKEALAERDARVLTEFINELLSDEQVNANQVAEFGDGLPTVFIKKLDVLNFTNKYSQRIKDGE